MELSPSAKEFLEVADRLFKAIERGDVDSIRNNIYAADAKIWHNFDDMVQSVDENLATLKWAVERSAASGLPWGLSSNTCSAAN